MSSPSSHVSLNCYQEAANVLSDPQTALEMSSAFDKLAQRQATMVSSFTNILNQTVALDLQRIAPPMQPTWTRFQSQFSELHQLCLNNVSSLHGRLKMFLTTILPLMAKHLPNDSAHSRREKAQIIESFVKMSFSHLSYTSSYVGSFLNAATNLTNFHLEVAKYSAQRPGLGREQICSLATKLLELDAGAKELCHAASEASGIDLLASSLSRILATFGHRKLKLKITHSDSEHYDRLYGEAVHANYTLQVSQRQTDALTTTRTSISSLIFDVSGIFTHAMIFMMGAWMLLQNDCRQLTTWLQFENTSLPHCLLIYMDRGQTLYAPTVTALETYLAQNHSSSS